MVAAFRQRYPQTLAHLMLPHRCYLKPINELLEKHEIKGMAHVTGGGIAGNLVRIMPDNTRAIIRKSSWKVPPIFDFIQKSGSIAEDDMFEAFNMGIGYILVVSEDSAPGVLENLKASGETAYIIGNVEQGGRDVILKD